MTQVNFRIDEEVKERAESVLNDMGLSMSSAITMFFRSGKVGTKFFSKKFE